MKQPSKAPVPPQAPNTAPVVPVTPVAPAQHEQDALDEALAESFPSSDPVAITVTREAPPKR